MFFVASDSYLDPNWEWGKSPDYNELPPFFDLDL